MPETDKVEQMVEQIDERERLAKIAEALDVLAKHAYLYGGPRTRPRRILEVKAEKTLRIKYEDGRVQYVVPYLVRRFTVYLSRPKHE
jgi:hypothetical protein